MALPRSKIYIRAIRLWQNSFRRVFQRLGLPAYARFAIYSVIMGLAAGLASVGFHQTIDFISFIFLKRAPEMLSFAGSATIIGIPVIGMLIQSAMIAAAPELSRKRGVLEVIKAITLRGGFIRLRTTLFHFIAPAISIGTGATVGPEGPAAQIGAGVASKLSRAFSLSEANRRMFTAAGSGAAIAAVFNTPLGGVFFALEVILLNDFQTATFSALILASVTASAVAQALLGNEPTFVFTAVKIGAYAHFYLYAILGLGAGLLSVLFIKYAEKIDWFFNTVLLRKLPQWLLMSAIGAFVGLAGSFYREIFGIGYRAINEILAGELTWDVVLILLFLKFLLVPAVLKAGGFGGIFAPSLFLGACYGYLFATAVNSLQHSVQVDPVTFTLVGMGAVLGGINSIPIASILILFEMTRDYSFILPLMLGVVISTSLVYAFVRGSVYEKHLEEQGFRISGLTETNILQRLTVNDVMRKDAVLISENTSLPELLRQCIESPHETFFTIDAEGNLSGMITLSNLRPLITEYEHLRSMGLIARDIAEPCRASVRCDNNLEFVLSLFENDLDLLPVVDDRNPRRVLGTVGRQDIISAYHRESLRYNIADSFVHSLRELPPARMVRVTDGYAIVERPAPKSFAGKTLSRLKIRNRYGVEVLMIKQKQDALNPERERRPVPASPGYTIQEGDVLLLFGPVPAIEATQAWEQETSA